MLTRWCALQGVVQPQCTSAGMVVVGLLCEDLDLPADLVQLLRGMGSVVRPAHMIPHYRCHVKHEFLVLKLGDSHALQGLLH